MKLFLDTNVYLDFLLEREPFAQDAAYILSKASDRCIDVAISSVTAVTADYVCVERCKMPRQVMSMKVLGLKSIIGILTVDSSDVWNSYLYKWKDMEDGSQCYCAQRNGCDYIVTRNPKDFKDAIIPIISPKEAIELIKGNR